MMSDNEFTMIEADSVLSFSKDFKRKRYILMRNGTIETISDTRPLYPRMRCLNFRGYKIVPFFCDYHLHFPGSALPSSQKILKDLLENGIHKVFEAGDCNLSGIEMKKLLKESLEIKNAGHALYKNNTYGKFIGKGVDSFSEARGLIDQLCELKVDYIKLINSGIFDVKKATITSGGFEQKELGDIVSYARERGLDVFCHANGDRQIQEAVSAGVSCIVHGLFITDETLDVMAEKGIAFIPTVNAFASLGRTTNDPGAQSNIKRVIDGHLYAVSKAVKQGVKVRPGSDSGPNFIPYGKAYHKELGFFREAGLSDEQILTSAVDSQLREEMLADFLVLKGIEIEKIFINGDCTKESNTST